jgi:hypothetical protein
MSQETPPPGEQPPHTPQPSWGAAYPPPPGGYPPQPGYNPYMAPPKHPQATTSMVLGIVSVAGGVLCWLPLLISPVAWIMGAKAVREIDASRGAQSGRSEAVAGKVLGIIGTVLLALGIALIVLLVVLSFTIDDFWSEDNWSDDGSWDQTSSLLAPVGAPQA